jgi:hypothetical protein
VEDDDGVDHHPDGDIRCRRPVEVVPMTSDADAAEIARLTQERDEATQMHNAERAGRVKSLDRALDALVTMIAERTEMRAELNRLAMECENLRRSDRQSGSHGRI